VEPRDALRVQWLHRRALALWQRVFLDPGQPPPIRQQDLRSALDALRAADRLAPPHPERLALEALVLQLLASLEAEPSAGQALRDESADALHRRLLIAFPGRTSESE
jgi:hypothetical protein